MTKEESYTFIVNNDKLIIIQAETGKQIKTTAEEIFKKGQEKDLLQAIDGGLQHIKGKIEILEKWIQEIRLDKVFED